MNTTTVKSPTFSVEIPLSDTVTITLRDHDGTALGTIQVFNGVRILQVTTEVTAYDEKDVAFATSDAHTMAEYGTFRMHLAHVKR